MGVVFSEFTSANQLGVPRGHVVLEHLFIQDQRIVQSSPCQTYPKPSVTGILDQNKTYSQTTVFLA